MDTYTPFGIEEGAQSRMGQLFFFLFTFDVAVNNYFMKIDF